GDDAPTDVHPNNLYVDGSSRVNRTQFVPLAATNMRNHRREHANLCTAMEGVFEWIEESLRTNCPQEFEEICIFAGVLPCNTNSPVYPFGGFVLNFNISTKIHRDHMDVRTGCGVLVIGVHKGGHLCLLEPGIVIGAWNGDFIFFLSRNITHFNLHYSGKRASIVFHTDIDSSKWVEGRNGWDNNVYFCGTPGAHIVIRPLCT
ncbi:hypothetical protein FISHEDRAFT_54036, partial [Fistulina hepatica ATCC 64428]